MSHASFVERDMREALERLWMAVPVEQRTALVGELNYLNQAIATVGRLASAVKPILANIGADAGQAATPSEPPEPGQASQEAPARPEETTTQAVPGSPQARRAAKPPA